MIPAETTTSRAGQDVLASASKIVMQRRLEFEESSIFQTIKTAKKMSVSNTLMDSTIPIQQPMRLMIRFILNATRSVTRFARHGA